MSLTLAIMIHATAVVIDFSKSLAKPAFAVDPSEGPLDDPAARQQHEALGNVRPLDDVDRPVAEWHERLLVFFARIATIGEDVAQPREGASDRAQKRGCAVAILDIRRMDDRADQQSAGVGEDVSLAALIFLPASKPRGPPASVVLTDWLSITPADGLASRPATSRACINR